MYACQSTRTFAVRWPPDAPRYLVTFGPKHNYSLERELDWGCTCPDAFHQRYPSGRQRLHKGHPEWDPRYCKHVNAVRQIWCGWRESVDGGAPARVGGALVCPRCGLPVVEE